jgi:GAF domain-containing protein
LELERRLTEVARGAARPSTGIVTDDSAVGDAIAIVLTDLRRDVPYDSCSVQELRGSRLVIIGGVGFADLDVILGESFEVDSADIPNSEVIHRRRALRVPDTEIYRAFRRGLHVGAGIRSWLGVPLLAGPELLGMLALDKAEADFYTDRHQQIALAYASVLAASIARQRSA